MNWSAVRHSRLARDLLILLVVMAPIALVYLLPPDTSFSEVERIGTLTACIPSDLPPLAQPSAADPGFDITVLTEIARRLKLQLALNVNALIGRDFNPRNWGITRASCQVIAGGLVVSPTTKSFLETLPTGIETGWTALTTGATTLKKGMRIGIFPGFGGLDRVALSRVLRAEGLSAQLVESAAALGDGLRQGIYDAGITDSLTARAIVEPRPGLIVGWLAEGGARASLGFGLWKGDLTLKRQIAGALDAMQRDGFVAAARDRYKIATIDRTIGLE